MRLLKSCRASIEHEKSKEPKWLADQCCNIKNVMSNDNLLNRATSSLCATTRFGMNKDAPLDLSSRHVNKIHETVEDAKDFQISAIGRSSMYKKELSESLEYISSPGATPSTPTDQASKAQGHLVIPPFEFPVTLQSTKTDISKGERSGSMVAPNMTTSS